MNLDKTRFIQLLIVMQKIFQVIVVGAGISGIAASVQLSKANIEHIIIQARDRIGGRITSIHFDGVQVQLGAAYIHKPQKNNRIAEIIQQKGIQSKQRNLEDSQHSQFVFQGKGQIQKEIKEKAFLLFQELQQQIQNKKKKSQVDMSLQETAHQFFKKIENQSEQIQSMVRCLFANLGHNQGAENYQISAKFYDNDISQFDIVPDIGYSGVVKEIAKDSKAEIKLNEEVTKVDYCGQVIKVYTKKGFYLSKKVISSLPLAVLQNKVVEFHPQIPESHRLNLQKIGISVLRKIYVSFQKPFWDISKNLVQFISHNPTRYPVAVSIIVNEEKYILCFFPSIASTRQMSLFSDEFIKDDLLKYLNNFKFQEEIRVKEIFVTRWLSDPYSLGTYSYFKVGEKVNVDAIRQPIDNKLWFIGEYCSPGMSGCAHAAFETGEWAAQQIIDLAKEQK